MEIKRIQLDALGNTRDLGGMETRDGRRIKEKRLIRSGQLYHATELDKKVLTQEYQLKTIIDFRTAMERIEKPDPEMDGVDYIVNPILEEQELGITREDQAEEKWVSLLEKLAEYGVEAAANYMEAMYEKLMTNDFSRRQYTHFFEILLKQKEGSVLWHCTAGKDRVGTGCVLLLSALGIPRETIVEDYMKTGVFIKQMESQLSGAIAKEMENDSSGKEALKEFMGVRKSYVDRLFQVMEEQCGTVEKYLEEVLNVDEEKREKLKSLYLV